MSAETFAVRLKDLMEIANYNQITLERAIQTNRKTIRYWLSGRYFPNYKTLLKLAELFNCSIDYLLGEGEPSDANISIKKFDGSNVKKRLVNLILQYINHNNITINAFANLIDIDHKSVERWLTKGGMPETLIYK